MNVSALAPLRFLILTLALIPIDTAIAQSEATEETVERLFAAPAKAFDPALPETPFGTWFDEILPKRSGRYFKLTPCSPDNTGGHPRGCLTIEVDIVSRHRNLRLVFDRDSLAFRGGALSSIELEGIFAVGSLAALPKLLKRGMRPFPLDCPANTDLKLRESYAGLFEWCEDAGGARQGPTRAWLSTGIYLLYRGQYADGPKTGDWTECNRFERCAFNRYKNGVKQ